MKVKKAIEVVGKSSLPIFAYIMFIEQTAAYSGYVRIVKSDFLQLLKLADKKDEDLDVIIEVKKNGIYIH